MKLLFLCLLGTALVAGRYSSDSEEEAPKQKIRVSTLERYRNRELSTEAEELSGDELIDYVNDNQNLWTAKKQRRFTGKPDKAKWGLMGVNHVRLSVEAKKHLSSTKDLDLDIPESFDSRQQWPECESIKAIRDQSSCGSCWAFGAAEAMSDRICIASSGKTKVSISADDILACCGAICGNGCEGGYPIQAWKHWVSEGFVTGGNYTSKAGCKPYPYPPCEHHNDHTTYNACPADLYPTDSCKRTCQDGYSNSYKQDTHYGSTAYAVAHNVQALQKELLTNGPVELSFTVYEDFEHYTSGVYVHTAGKNLGGHAVKLIGWGTDAGTPYWLIANSWNSDWGENGFFRIIRGVNECGIESGGVAGEPKV